jgi:proteic killer suppression protein
MIGSFRHRGLRRLFESGDRSGIRAAYIDKVERILARLDAATAIDEVDAPGFGLHPLRGDRKGILGDHRQPELARGLPLPRR